jgi:hypothetical protein
MACVDVNSNICRSAVGSVSAIQRVEQAPAVAASRGVHV